MTRGILAGFVLLLVVTSALAKDELLPEYERVVLENGTVLLLSEKHDVPIIGMRAVIRGGAAEDPADKAGLASLFAGMLEKGAGGRSAAEFAEAVAAVGGELSSSAGLETITVAAEFLSRDGELMLELVSDMLRRPALQGDEFIKLRDRSINLIRAA
ncbi:MAG: insulinase family protein, partial [Gammaproteobacteria bacterium]|nr:insulinase family protein [Gammaproteobacteria bacterium]